MYIHCTVQKTSLQNKKYEIVGSKQGRDSLISLSRRKHTLTDEYFLMPAVMPAMHLATEHLHRPDTDKLPQLTVAKLTAIFKSSMEQYVYFKSNVTRCKDSLESKVF